MATKQPKYLELEEIVIPSRTFERGTHKDFQFAPSRIVSLADATYNIKNTKIHIGNSHAQMPKIADVDYKGVKFINLYIEGYGGFGGCCPTLNRKDYEELKRRCYASDNDDMVGKVVTAIYDENNAFAGFVAPHTHERDLKRFERRRKAFVSKKR